MKVLVGVCGGIAAYKAAELVRALQGNGLEVQVAMTASAERFMPPLTFAALTGTQVFTSLWQPSPMVSGEPARFDIEHIRVAQEIKALAVAPATANILAKFAHGIADDFLTTLYLATRAPVLLAPAMNVNMWQHPATAANVAALQGRGVRFVHPEAGYLACGMVGDGRLAPVETIAAEIFAMLVRLRDLTGDTLLITAGGTREPLDPVRFLGNRSSGRMGYALAEAAVARGANVVLVTAAALPDPRGSTIIRVSTAAEMARAVLENLPNASIVIKAAAVSDFRPRSISPQKLRRCGPLTVELEPTEDITQAVVQRRRPGTLVIAFAAETENLEANARAKLLLKGVDAIVANDVSGPETGFETAENAGLFLTAGETVPLSRMPKASMADCILDEACRMRRDVRNFR